MIPSALTTVPGRVVLLLDGGSGSGKTTLAHAMADRWPTPITVVSLDSFYPGWDGLAQGSAMVARDVLRASDPGYRRWDWTAGRSAAWVPIDPTASLIVEGCGALTPANRALATAGIWLVRAPRERRALALARDGEVFAPHWEQWAAQERLHWHTHHPRDLADWWVHDDRFTRGPGRRRPAPPRT